MLAYAATGPPRRPATAPGRTRSDSRPSPPRPASLPSGVSLVSVSTYGPDHGVTVTARRPPIVVITDRTITRSVTMP